AAPSEFGNRIADYVRLDFSTPVLIGERTWAGTILKVDRFGNLITNFDSETWRRLGMQMFQMGIGGKSVSCIASNYAEMPEGELFVIEGSAGFLEVSVNRGSAAERLGARSGDPFELRLR